MGDPKQGNRYAYGADNPVSNAHLIGMVTDEEVFNIVASHVGAVVGAAVGGMAAFGTGNPTPGLGVGGCMARVLDMELSVSDRSWSGAALACAAGRGLAAGAGVMGL